MRANQGAHLSQAAYLHRSQIIGHISTPLDLPGHRLGHREDRQRSVPTRSQMATARYVNARRQTTCDSPDASRVFVLQSGHRPRLRPL